MPLPTDPATLVREIESTAPRRREGDRVFYLVEGDLLVREDHLLEWATQRVAAAAAVGVRRLTQALGPDGAPLRWPAGTVLAWCTDRASFPTPAAAALAERSVLQASAEWMGVVPILFEHHPEWTALPADTTGFVLRYAHAENGFVATAFFPPAAGEVDWDPTLRVYPAFFRESGYDRVGVLRHELGHVLGFRHEHARPDAYPAVRRYEDDLLRPLTAYDPYSVMHYFIGGYGTRTLGITEVDKTGAREAYGGAAAPPPTGPGLAAPPPSALALATGHPVWQGFHYAWGLFPHRVSQFVASALPDDGFHAKVSCIQNSGHDADQGIFTNFLTRVELAGIEVRSCSTRLEVGDRWSGVGDDRVAEGRTEARIPVERRAGQEAIVLLTGVEWAPRGDDVLQAVWPTTLDLGVRVETVGAGSEVVAHFAVGHADAPDVKDAPEGSTTHRVTLHWMLLVGPPERLAAEGLPCRARDVGLHDGIYEGRGAVPRRAGAATFLGMRGLTFNLRGKGPGPNGRYFQRWGFGLEQLGQSADHLQYRWRAGAGAGLFVHAARYDAALDAVAVFATGARADERSLVREQRRWVPGSSMELAPLEERVDLWMPTELPDAVALHAIPAGQLTDGLSGDALPRPPGRARVPRGGSYAGVARIALDVPDGVSMAGYSVGAPRGRNLATDPLECRVMYLEDASGSAVAFVTCDLMSGTRALHELVAAQTRQTCGLDVHEIVLLGTHTHAAPGGIFGNSMYDTLANTFGGYRADVVQAIAERVAEAIHEAWTTAEPARVSMDAPRLWGVSRNRSLEPFLANDLAWNSLPGGPGEAPPALSDQQRAIDPRVHVLSAWSANGRRLGLLATFGCHNTAQGMQHARLLGPKPVYCTDWAGVAARALEADPVGGARVALVGLSTAGDVSPLPPDDDRSHYEFDGGQGLPLTRFVGERVAATVRAAGSAGAAEPISLTTWYEDWEPRGGVPGIPASDLEPFMIGLPVLGGAEDGRSFLYGPKKIHEGMVRSGQPGRGPKIAALGVLQTVLVGVGAIAPSPVLPLHVVRVNRHAFGTVPGEPTVVAGWRIERSLLARLHASHGVESASVLGFAGDYAGYFTTEKEYARQHYEGAHTLYGPASTTHLAARLALNTSGAPGALTRHATWDLPKTPSLHRADDRGPVATRVERNGLEILAAFTWMEPSVPPEEPRFTLKVGGGTLDPLQVSREQSGISPEFITFAARFNLPDGAGDARVVVTASPSDPFPRVRVEDPAAGADDALVALEPDGRLDWLDLYRGLARDPVPPVQALVVDDPDAFTGPGDGEGIDRFLGPDQVDALVQAFAERPLAVSRALLSVSAPLPALDDETLLRQGRERLQALVDLFGEGGAKPALAEAKAQVGGAAGLAVPLPDGFDFPGYDPTEIPVVPGQTQFQDGDWLGYAVLGGALYHLDLRRLEQRRPGPEFGNFVHDLADPGRPLEFALFADFANGLYAPRYIAKQMCALAKAGKLDAAFHLGDVYYGGRPAEFENYLRKPLKDLLPNTPFFLLPGNHDLYSGGEEFHAFLDWKRDKWPAVQGQRGATFRVRFPGLQIVGGDTQYWRHGRMHRDVVELVRGWLEEGRANGDLNVLLTSQHGFDFGKSGLTSLYTSDLQDVLNADLVDVWFWGNTHYAAVYEPRRVGGFVSSCIGWSGYPYFRLDEAKAAKSAAPVVWAEYAHRFHPWPGVREDVGNNGWVRARWENGELSLRYIDWMGNDRATFAVRRQDGLPSVRRVG